MLRQTNATGETHESARGDALILSNARVVTPGHVLHGSVVIEKIFGLPGLGSYFVSSIAPGTHVYTVHSEAKDVLTIEVEAGETYYVQGSITMGILAGRPNLSPSDEAAFNGMADADPANPLEKMMKPDGAETPPAAPPS